MTDKDNIIGMAKFHLSVVTMVVVIVFGGLGFLSWQSSEIINKLEYDFNTRILKLETLTRRYYDLTIQHSEIIKTNSETLNKVAKSQQDMLILFANRTNNLKKAITTLDEDNTILKQYK